MRDFSHKSNCCWTDSDPDMEICSHCKEHCKVEEVDESQDKASFTSDDQIEKIIQHHLGNPVTMRIDLEILRHMVKREQMIEDHNLYMGEVKES